MKNWPMQMLPLILMVMMLVACATPPAPGPGQAAPKRVSVQFYLVHEEPGPDIVERKVAGTGETVFLAQKPDLTESDMAWAQTQVDRLSGRASVLAHFTIEGSDKLAALTRRNIGRRIAIVIDGKIIATPLITSQIPNGRLLIEGFKSAAEAQRVADALAKR